MRNVGWTSLRSLIGKDWNAESLKKLAEESFEKGVAWADYVSKYNVKISLRYMPEFPGKQYEAGVSAEYKGLSHGHYGLIVNWRGAVFLAESD